MTRAEHNISVWARDLKQTAWAWSCKCGARYTADLPDREAARAEAYAHRNAAERGTGQPTAA